MSTLVASRHNIHSFGESPSPLKRKAEALVSVEDLLNVSLQCVKRTKTSPEDTAWHSKAQSGHQMVGFRLPPLSAIHVPGYDLGQSLLGAYSSQNSNVGPEMAFGTIGHTSGVGAHASDSGVVASTEYPPFVGDERDSSLSYYVKVASQPPPTRSPRSSSQSSSESVANSPAHNKWSDDEPSSYDLYLDLDIDPESEDLEDVNDELWGSTMLFFIGKELRERQDSSPSPSPPQQRNIEIVQRQEAEPMHVEKEKKKNKKNKRRRGHFPKATTDMLKCWLFDHMDHPYPTEEEKLVLAEDTGLTVKQINYWFTNSRRRFLKPKNE